MNLIPRNSLFYDMFDLNNDLFKDSFMKSDIYKKDNIYNIEIDMPGIRKEDITMEVENGYLTVTVKKEDEQENREYLHKERYYGKMMRTFYIGEVDESMIHASFQDGILKISFEEEDKSKNKKQITID